MSQSSAGSGSWPWYAFAVLCLMLCCIIIVDIWVFQKTGHDDPLLEEIIRILLGGVVGTAGVGHFLAAWRERKS